MAGKWLLRPPDPPKFWFDNFDRPDEEPATGWLININWGPPKIVAGELQTGVGGFFLTAYQPGKSTSDHVPTLLFGPNQYSRVTLGTVGGNGLSFNGLGPCVRVGGAGDPLPYGYDLIIGNSQSELWSPTSSLGSWEPGVTGDTWELQIWGTPTASWLRVLRNNRIIATVRDQVTATANIPRSGMPGVASQLGMGTITRWEGGELPGDMVPWFAQTENIPVAFMQADAFQVADYDQSQPVPGGTAFQVGQSDAFQGPAGVADLPEATTAFQQDAFQTDAFQIYGTATPTTPDGSTTPPHPGTSQQRRKVRHDEEALQALLMEQIRQEDAEILKVIEVFLEQGTVYRMAA